MSYALSANKRKALWPPFYGPDLAAPPAEGYEVGPLAAPPPPPPPPPPLPPQDDVEMAAVEEEGEGAPAMLMREPMDFYVFARRRLHFTEAEVADLARLIEARLQVLRAFGAHEHAQASMESAAS